ncbi:MAG: ABC transporter substrate-binding protein [Halopseudomonas aestusnigri]
MKITKLIFLVLFFAGHKVVVAENLENITIATNDFCPFICTDVAKKGFTVEITEKIFKSNGIKVDFVMASWARTVEQVIAGRVSGILAPGKDEVPSDSIFPKRSIAIQKNCFFTAKNNTWKYESVKSLKKIRVVSFIYGPHNKKFKKYLGNEQYSKFFEEIAFDSDYHERASRLVDLNRADAFWAEPSVMKNLMIKNKKLSEYRNAGCYSSMILYIAFTPKNREESLKLSEMFDDGIEKLRSSNELDSILKKYNIGDWIGEKEVKFH